ncbi:hypothetical protein MB901379_01276 [Mycobacterium basiliense]|uniref:Uncharacterized protein n=1 Tax=Mycobacterium basiliense TaxID=2094119 RepID=A0A447GB80_9MYCO|nr:DUF5994 family protein [Mycobacterium basiliense]VDM87731.1 hypothetical protein MB901379_01276 [Mycobacterium basiliense]
MRLALAPELGAPLDGAWWPHSASIARELPELVDALAGRLGNVLAISVNWSSLESSPDLDALNCPTKGDHGRVCGHQRLMMITGSRASATLLVIPSRTSAVLAKMVLRKTAGLFIMPTERETREFQTSDVIMHAAFAESRLCGQRLQGPELAAAAVDPAMTR